MICKNIENNEIFNCYKANSFCWHLWNADNDFRIDIDSFDEEYELIDKIEDHTIEF
jgi:hypothetical protein